MGHEEFPLKKYLLRYCTGVSALNDGSKQIYNYRLPRARRDVENAVSIVTQKFTLFYGRIQLSLENAEKVVLVVVLCTVLLLLSVGLPVANAPDVLQPCGLLYYP